MLGLLKRVMVNQQSALSVMSVLAMLVLYWKRLVVRNLHQRMLRNATATAAATAPAAAPATAPPPPSSC